MKRSPLPPRRTALAPGKPLQRRTGLRPGAGFTGPRRPLPRESARTRRDRPTRTLVRAAVLTAIPTCQACGVARSYDVHERLTRARGGNPLNPINCLALCRRCHDWAHDYPAAAEAAGLLLGSTDPEPGCPECGSIDVTIGTVFVGSGPLVGSWPLSIVCGCGWWWHRDAVRSIEAMTL